jgi:hypothetical protein
MDFHEINFHGGEKSLKQKIGKFSHLISFRLAWAFGVAGWLTDVV